MLPENIRISSRGRDQLIRLKRLTGIKQWNILCRWAFCISMKQDIPISLRPIVADSNIEMSWRTFSGQYDEVYKVLLAIEARNLKTEDFANVLSAHIHRGLGILSAQKIHNIEDILATDK